MTYRQKPNSYRVASLLKIIKLLLWSGHYIQIQKKKDKYGKRLQKAFERCLKGMAVKWTKLIWYVLTFYYIFGTQ